MRCTECVDYFECSKKNNLTIKRKHCPMAKVELARTNADRIRSMTDEELEAFLIDVDLDKVGSPFITEWGKWLKQPAEE